MAYVSIYRKYRPAGFDGVVGQDHIVRILSNQIKNDSIGHAYLFTGTRGTGKTSIAKIFARAVNCLSPVNGSACGECEVCKALADPSNLDIIEIDAASNNGVDEIRELRESVQYPPVVSRYKVYIIDEVHMLSIGAFNALLKTLEEPPKHVVFILATTEVHKLPQTILSRCLRFDFRLVPTTKLAMRIKYIFDDMGVTYTDDALLQIAEAGDGSVRDALSVADMCVSYGEGNVTYDTVLEVLGASNPNTIIDIIESVAKGDVASAFEYIDQVAVYGKSMTMLARDLVKMFRNLYVVINANEPYKVLNIPRELVKRLLMIDIDADRVLQCVDIMSGIEADMRYSTMPRVLVESAIAKCADVKANVDLTGLAIRLKRLEERIASGNLVATGGSVETRPQVNKAKRAFTPSGCCGFLIKAARSKKKLLLYSELSELEKENYSIKDGVVYLSPLNENMYKNLNESEYYTMLRDLVVSEFDKVEDFKIKPVEKTANIDDDIARLKSMLNNNKDVIKSLD